MIGAMSGRIVSPELIGRDNELEAISRGLASARAGHGRTVLVGGEAGIGKSRLLTAALDSARAEGATVLQGGCVSLAEGALPFAPIVEALRPLLADSNPQRRRSMVGALASGVADTPAVERADPRSASAPESFVQAPPQSGMAGSEYEAGDALDAALLGVAAELGIIARHRTADAAAELRPEWARSQLYETFLGLLRRLSTDAPVVLAIEDLHWAGDSTRELLAFLIRNIRTERVLLVITFRSDELHRRHPLLFWLGEADRLPGVDRIELGRLERPGLARQLAGILGRAPDAALIDSIFGRSEGNPFFAEELVAAGAETESLPPTLREVLAARLAQVSEPTLRLLGVAAVVGRSVDHDLLARASELTEDQLDEALDEAISAQLLVAEKQARSARYAFRHALLAEAAADTVLPGRRRRLHAAIAQALSESNGMRGAEGAGHLIEIAHHWFEARELGSAFEASLLAGDAAQASGAYAEALRQYERATELWDIVPDREAHAEIDRVELLRRTAHSAQLSGEYSRAIQLLKEAIDLARGCGEPVLQGLLYERLGRSLWTSGDFPGAEDAYRRAIELVPEEPASADRARVLAGYAQVLMLAGHIRESISIARRALELARATGSRQLEGHSLCTLGADFGYNGDADTGVPLVREALTIAEEVQDLDDIGRAYACLSSTLDSGGRIDEATSVALEGAHRMRDLGMGATYGAFNLMNASDGMVFLGRWDEALAMINEAQSTARGTSRIFANNQLALLLTWTGDWERAASAIEEVSGTLGRGIEAQFNGPMAATKINLAMLTGDTAGGRRTADTLLPILGQTEDEVHHARVLAAAVRLEASVGERARAARDTRTLDQAGVRVDSYLADIRALAKAAAPGWRLSDVEQSVALAEAEATRLAGATNADKWRVALDKSTSRGGPAYDIAYARYRLAEALLADRNARDQAEFVLAKAFGEASRLHARPLMDGIQSLAARARVQLPVQPVPSADATTAPVEPGSVDVGTAAQTAAKGAVGSDHAIAAYGLSEREVEVLRLLAAGRTNRQIGEALFISESTAGVHVSHILSKLGVAGRVEAATIAARLGLTA
jgi:DNA-binding CsgD family transcriptional regulator